MFRVKDKVAFDKCLGHVLPLLGSLHEIGQGKPYWKLPELWECIGMTPITGGSIAEQVGTSLLVAQRLASGWSIVGSAASENAEDFGGVFSLGHNNGASKTLGLEWASFFIRRGEG
jgi:hypothetical protein